VNTVMSGVDVSAGMRGPGSNACCGLSQKGAVEIRGLDDLQALVSRCRVVFVNFYSPLCTYCYLFEPVYRKVAEETGGKAAFARVNVAMDLELATLFGIMATPTTIALVNGKPVLAVPGYMDYEEFATLVQETLNQAGCSPQEA